MKKRILLLVSLSIVLTACSLTRTEDSMATSKISSIKFLKGSPPKKGKRHAYHLALTHGYLTLKDNCLYLAPKLGSEEGLKVLIWPWDYSLKETKGGIQVVDGSQKKIAEVGQYVKLGGGGLDGVNKECSYESGQSVWIVAPNFNLQ